MNRALLVIAKRPAAGQTKTRLGAFLAENQASTLYECFLRDTLHLARGVAGVARFIAYAPEDEWAYFKELAPDFGLVPQVGDGLGERLDNALTHCLNDGFQQAVIMDSDSPTLPVHYVRQAFDLLAGADVVLGPCADGGYYLIGLTRPQPRLLREVQMSTPNVLHDTLALAKHAGLSAALLPAWYDVDNVEGLIRLRREIDGAPDGIARNTRRYLKSDA